MNKFQLHCVLLCARDVWSMLLPVVCGTTTQRRLDPARSGGSAHRSTHRSRSLTCCAAFLGSIMMMPPSCAMASTCSTPAGRATRRGRWRAQGERRVTGSGGNNHATGYWWLWLVATARVSLMQLDGHRQLHAPGMMARCGKWPGKKLSLICEGKTGRQRGGATASAGSCWGGDGTNTWKKPASAAAPDQQCCCRRHCAAPAALTKTHSSTYW